MAHPITQSELVTFLHSWHEPLVGPPHHRIVRTLYGYYSHPGCRETVFMKHSSTQRREDRLEARLSPRAKAMLRRAASVERDTVSPFSRDQGLARAAASLAR